MRLTPVELVEIVFVVIGLAGVAAIYWPAALVLAGVLGVIACEYRAARAARQVKAGARRAEPGPESVS